MNKQEVLEVDKIAKDRNLGLGFVTIIEILKMEKVCRNVSEAHKEFKVYDQLQDIDVVVEFEDVIAILEIQKQVKNKAI